MADMRPWIQIWKCTQDDDGFQRLSMGGRGRWISLLLFVGSNGERGSVVVNLTSQTTASGIRGALRVSNGCASGDMRVRILRALRALPGVTVEWDDEANHLLRITFKKWTKYQEESSAERTRRWRHKASRGDGASASHGGDISRHAVTAAEEKRRDTPLPPTGFSVTATTQPDQPRTLPPEAFHWDCPITKWRGHCLSRQWLADHPECPRFPKQCPFHKQQDDEEVKPAW